MAYPFGPAIPYATFLDRLQRQFGCELRVLDKQYRDSRGDLVQFRYLRRMTDKGLRIAELPERDPLQEEMPSVVRSICAQLNVDNTAFGVLSGPDSDDDDDG